MAGNEASPHYPSDLVMITRADDPDGHPFEAYDVTTAPAEKLWAELSSPSWERRRAGAHVEILRRGGALLADAADRLAVVKADDPALCASGMAGSRGRVGEGPPVTFGIGAAFAVRRWTRRRFACWPRFRG